MHSRGLGTYLFQGKGGQPLRSSLRSVAVASTRSDTTDGGGWWVKLSFLFDDARKGMRMR